MRRAGIQENVIMKIAGWKTRSMFERYNIVDGRDLREAARRMEEHLKSARGRAAGTITVTVGSEMAQTVRENSNTKFFN